MKVKVAPSVLSANFSKLAEEIIELDKAGCDYIHIDVMDGNFVPDITIGPCVIRSIRGLTDKIFDVHLMVQSPEKHIKNFADAGADIITFHIEATKNPENTIQLIKNLGIKAGISLRPQTKVEEILDYIKLVDLILVMSVDPGAAGQEFISSQVSKIQALKNHIALHNLKVLVSVDGGINSETAKMSVDAGADVLVAGSFIFKRGDNYRDQINLLRV